MSKLMFRRPERLMIALAGVIFIGSLSGTPAGAAGDEAENPLRVEGRTVLDRLDKRLAEIGEWSRIQEQYEGEDRQAIGLELSEKRLQVLSDLRRLADNVAAQEEQGLDASAVRQRIEPLMLQVPGRIEAAADEAVKRASELRLKRESADPEQLLGLEQQIVKADARINRISQVYIDHIGAMETLGLDTAVQQLWLKDTLTRRATFLGRRLELAEERRKELSQQLDVNPEDSGVSAALQAARRRIDGDVHDLRVTLHLLDDLGIDTTEQQRQLAQATGELADMMDRDVAAGFLKRWLAQAGDWFMENGSLLLVKAFVVILVLLAFRVLARMARGVAVRSLKSSRVKTSRLLEDMILSMVSRAVMILGVLVALSQLGVELGPLLAGLGVAGFIVGFALQGVLSNFASGVMILFYRPFDVDDVVEVAGVFGKVSRMTLVSTTILTFDNQTLVVPNTKIWGDVIKNVTAQKIRRVDMTFGISYQDDIPKAEALLLAIVKEHAKVLEQPAPVIKLHTLGESSVDFIVRPWANTADYWEVYWDITREVKLRFDREAISIPFPQRDVHLFRQIAEDPAA